MQKNRAIIYAVLFGAYVGVSLPLPIMGPLIISEQSPFLVAAESKSFFLSVILSAFPLGHLVGAPILGSLSDRYGKKKLLLISLVFGAGCYALSGIAISLGNIWLLFVSRFFGGLFEGNAAIAQSYLVKDENKQGKTKLFGTMVAVISVGYIAGPLVSSIASDSSMFWFASYALPFYIVFIFLSVTAIVVLINLENDVPEKTLYVKNAKKIQTVFGSTTLLFLFFFALLLAMGRSLFTDYTASFLTIRFSLHTNDTSWIWVLLAFVWGSSALMAHVGSDHLSNHAKLFLASLGAGLMLLALARSHDLVGFCIFSSVAAIGLSLGGTLNAVLVSDACPTQYLGFVMGLLSAVNLLGEALACLFGGFLLNLDASAPFFSAGAILVAASIAFAINSVRWTRRFA